MLRAIKISLISKNSKKNQHDPFTQLNFSDSKLNDRVIFLGQPMMMMMMMMISDDD